MPNAPLNFHFYAEAPNPYAVGMRVNMGVDLFPKGFTPEELNVVYEGLLNGRGAAGLILEGAAFADVESYYNPGWESVSPAFILEAITIDKFSRTEKRMAALARVLNKYLADNKEITALDPIVGDPKKSGSFAYVMVQMPFSDGQVVSVVFHSPEGDKKRIGPEDSLIAFRWLLNKRDITHVVAPEDGAEVSLETIGKRVTQLVEKNSARFQSTQKDAVMQQKQLDDAKAALDAANAQEKQVMDSISAAQAAAQEIDAKASAMQKQLESQKAINADLENQIAALKAKQAAKPDVSVTGAENTNKLIWEEAIKLIKWEKGEKGFSVAAFYAPEDNIRMQYGEIEDTKISVGRNSADRYKTSDGSYFEKKTDAMYHELESYTKPRLIKDGYVAGTPSGHSVTGGDGGETSIDNMVKEAARWKGATMKVAKQVEGDKKAALKLSKMTTKGDLDAYLMRKFGIDDATARDVSNTLTAQNIPADMTAKVSDFANEPWVPLSVKEIDTDADLQALGTVDITSVGGENIYMEDADGNRYFAKVENTARFTVGPHDFSNETLFAAAQPAAQGAPSTFEALSNMPDGWADDGTIAPENGISYTKDYGDSRSVTISLHPSTDKNKVLVVEVVRNFRFKEEPDASGGTFGSIEDANAYVLKKMADDDSFVAALPVRIDPKTPEGYTKIMADEALQLQYQDYLDSFFDERIGKVIGSLKDYDWSTSVDYKYREKTINGFYFRVEAMPKQIGAGNNVVGVNYDVSVAIDLQGSDFTSVASLSDDLTKTPSELAAQIDAAAQQYATQEQPAPAADPAAQGGSTYTDKELSVFKTAITVASGDDVMSLRPSDVYRAFGEVKNMGESTERFKDWILSQGVSDRVAKEVNNVAEEINTPKPAPAPETPHAVETLNAIIRGDYQGQPEQIDRLLDECADELEKAGLFDQYEGLLNQAADILTSELSEKAKAVA